MPVQFSGIQKEHEAVRTRAGLFDVSHMGEFLVSGQEAASFLQAATTNDIFRLAPNQAQYSLMCYPDGGVVDDLLVYKLAEDRFMLVVNAANIAKDLDWLHKHAEGDVKIEDISEGTSLLAVQGPAASEIVQKVTDAPVAELAGFRFLQDVPIGEARVLVSRTGYTGEDGFELYIPAAQAVKVWEKLLQAGEALGLEPAGLGARDTLRFEAGLPLYGQELSPHISPIEAGLGMFVKIDKGEFIGREALAEQKQLGPSRKLVGVEMIERGIPRAHYPVYAQDGRKIGEITTGTQSPTLKTNVGLALLNQDDAALGSEVWVDIRGQKRKGQVVKTPFVKRTGPGANKPESGPIDRKIDRKEEGVK